MDDEIPREDVRLQLLQRGEVSCVSQGANAGGCENTSKLRERERIRPTDKGLDDAIQVSPGTELARFFQHVPEHNRAADLARSGGEVLEPGNVQPAHPQP